MNLVEAKNKRDKKYRTFVYKPTENGEMGSKKVGVVEAVELIEKEGWRLSPAEFTKDKNLINSQPFVTLCDDVSRDRNMCLNIKHIKDKYEIQELLFRMFGIKIRSDASIKTMRKRIIKASKEKGIL